MTLFRYLEKDLKDKFTSTEIITQLREMNFLRAPGEGYIPEYTRTDFTDALHDAFGFRTEYEIVTENQMKKYSKLQKAKKIGNFSRKTKRPKRHYKRPFGRLFHFKSRLMSQYAHFVEEMFDDLAEEHPKLIKQCKEFTADRGHDDTKIIVKLWDNYRIKPVIDIRNLWQDPDPTRLLGNHENVVHDYKGSIYCYCP